MIDTQRFIGLRGRCNICGDPGETREPGMEQVGSCMVVRYRCDRHHRAAVAKRTPRAIALGSRRVPLVVALLAGFFVGRTAIDLAACGSPPEPVEPVPVVVTEKRCLEGVEAPPVVGIPSVVCAGDEAFFCLSRVGYSLLVNQLTELYRYRDQVEGRCRPRSDEPGTTTTDTGDDR